MKRLLLISLLFITHFSGAQMHEWAKSFTAKQNSNNSHNTVWGLDIDSNNNTYAVGWNRDSFFVDTFMVEAQSNSPVFITKLNNDGEVKWVRTMYFKTGMNSNRLHLRSIKVVTSNRIIVYGEFDTNNFGQIGTTLMLSPNDSIVRDLTVPGFKVLFIAEYDSLGNLVYYQKIAEAGVHGSSATGRIHKDNDNNIYLLANITSANIHSRNSVTHYATQQNNLYNSVILKFSTHFDSLIWIKEFTATSSNSLGLYAMDIGRDGNIYIALGLRIQGSHVTIDDSTYVLPSNVINKSILAVMNTDGEIFHKGYFNTHLNQSDVVSSIDAIDTNNIYILGILKDTFDRGGVKYYVNNPYVPNNNNPSNQTDVFPFIAKISTQGADWVSMPSSKYLTTLTLNSYIAPSGTDKIAIDKKGFIYSQFRFHGASISMGGLSDTIPNNNQIIFLKCDSLGNSLWLKSGVAALDMSPNSNNELVYCGTYNGQLELVPFVLNSQGGSGFIAKITDYSITRGEVSYGPYCAGDTFLVPYTKMGEYDTSNFFIAELSDENGNFEGGERELGRIKAIEDSTIIGQLPLFQVASSPNYRIRVRSTHPPVQSFYRLDSLRLLIYSRDKADPGPPETVCHGDTFTLNTFGGTAWQ